MGIKKSTRPRLKRTATLMAALGALTMSTGAALLVTAQSANAEVTPVNICHATSSDSNPYTFITVDNDSVKKLAGHLAHRNDPNKRWKSDGTFNGVPHVANQPKPDIIGDYVTPEGDTVVLDGVVNEARCNGEVVVEVPDEPTTGSVSFTDPTCENENTASYSTEGEHATFELDGTVAPGESVTVTATVEDGFTFPDDAQQLEFDHTFTAAEDCSVVTPPDTDTPDTDTPDTDTPEASPTVVATPTVVHAGLVGSPVSDLHTQQGMALLAFGFVMMLVAGGLVLRPARGAARS